MNIKPAIVCNQGTDAQSTHFIKPVSLDQPPYNEQWLQDLVQAHPELIPASEIEPYFHTLVPILTEFSLPSGYLDNFLITPDGYPVLIEVKLWKNTESRRKVVAQILEYAKDFAALNYADLNAEIVKHNRTLLTSDNPLYDMVSDYTPDPLDEQVFVDRVSRNLREGRFLLIILGDGIREELEVLSSYLMHHSLRYAFGLVQVKLFEMPDGDMLALPSLMVKTQTIERHVTVVTSADNSISVTTPAPVVTERTEKTSLSTDAFYDELNAVSPKAVVWIKALLNELSEQGVEAFTGSGKSPTLTFKAPLPNGEQMGLIWFNQDTVEFWGVPNKRKTDPAWQELSFAFLSKIASYIDGATVARLDSGHMDIKINGQRTSINTLVQTPVAKIADIYRQVMIDAETYFSEQD